MCAIIQYTVRQCRTTKQDFSLLFCHTKHTTKLTETLYFMPHTSKKIGSVQRAIDILNLFGGQISELGTTDIARALGLHKSTVASLVYTLNANGFLRQNPDTLKYSLGLKLVERAFVMLDQIEIRQVANPFLRELRNQWNETVNLAVLNGSDIVYIERFLGTKALGMNVEVGRRAPAHGTGLGKAILSCLPLPEVQTFIEQYGLPAQTLRTITDPDRFLAELDKTRERGFAVDDEEYELGGCCVAAPIFDHTGKPIAAVSISAPTARLSENEIPQAGAMVCETAKSISLSLGYLPRS
ncbi:MAG: IclR family transcriptional regulator [Anaerolineae bacterium]|nr:IclR family transcriptional regulator [Anaerolineae bacterium]